MTVSTSGSTNYSTNRDQVISRALRIVGALGQGETAPTAAITEASIALNDLVKHLMTDGMPLWALRESSFTMVAGTASYAVGTGQTFAASAPLKIIQAWTVDTSNNSSPINIITRDKYDSYGDKTSSGAVTQLYYNPPGAAVAGAAGESTGTLVVYQKPTSTDPLTLKIVGQRPFEDFDASVDVPDFPQYWTQALTWLLAKDLSYEYGVAFAERSMIAKMADMYHQDALSFGTEEGSLFIQPSYPWGGGA